LFLPGKDKAAWNTQLPGDHS